MRSLISFAAAMLVASFTADLSMAQAKLALERLEGKWTGAGTVNNQKVRAELDLARVLANRFVQLRYRFVTDGGAVFEGHAYYGACPAAGACTGHWFDSQGSAHALSATQTADTLTSEWRTGDTPRGRTEYRLTGDTALVVTDFIRAADGTWRQFGQVSYQRGG
jgi:Protein of unknown function (DUF1579)